MHSWMIREHKVSVIKRSEKIFQVHFVHKTIKKRFHSSAAQEPGPLKSQRFFMAFLSLAVRLFRKASTSAWCMITDRDFFFLVGNFFKHRKLTHWSAFFPVLFFLLLMTLSSRALKLWWIHLCGLSVYGAHSSHRHSCYEIGRWNITWGFDISWNNKRLIQIQAYISWCAPSHLI